MNEIIFWMQESTEGGYKAHALGHSVFTQAETEEELRVKIQEVTESHFGPRREVKIVTGFEHAPQTKIEIFRPYVDEILTLLGPEAADMLATDESIIFDACGDFFSGECDLSPLIVLGIEVTEHDYIWEVAAPLKRSREYI